MLIRHRRADEVAHTGEVGGGVAEGVGHSHIFQQGGDVGGFFQAEPGHRQYYGTRTEVGDDFRCRCAVQGGGEVAEPVGGGQDYQHRQLMTGVGQGYGLVVVAFCVAELAGLMHHWRQDGGVVGTVEVVVLGVGFVKVVVLGPLAFEIDGAGDEHCGAGVGGRPAGGEGVFADDSRDFAIGLRAGPLIDVGGGLGFAGIVGKVGALEVGAVVGGEPVEELLVEGVAFLAPEGVGDV